MKTIYCISGLGADEKAFSKLHIDGFELKVIPWLMPLKNEALSEYAQRMRVGIKEDNPVLMGLSFGGIVCTEIAKQIPVSRIIIISSIKSSKELPGWMRMVAMFKLNRIFPMRSSRLTRPFQNLMLGISGPEEKTMVYQYRKNADIKYTSWAIDQVVNWKNDMVHPGIFHIHGDNDHMFPIKHIKADFTIKNAGHFMIMNRASEVSHCINSILQQA
jgi:pimeloyl-ACP methyl ester carboxylesterase